MHRYPQNQSYVGSSGQTLTLNVSMTVCNWQICHPTHDLCGCTTFVPNQIRYQLWGQFRQLWGHLRELWDIPNQKGASTYLQPERGHAKSVD